MNSVGSVRKPRVSSSVRKSGVGRVTSALFGRTLLVSSLLFVVVWLAACGGGADSLGPVAVGSVTVTGASAPLASIGATVQLTATVEDSGGHVLTGETVTWQSSNTGVATVSNSGLVTAVGNGNASITATAGGVSGSVIVNVAQVVTAVVVTPGTSTLVSFGETKQLTATPKDANGNAVLGQTAIWSSSDNGIATIGTNGLATAVANGGPVTMTATIGLVSGTATVTVAQAVNTISVTPSVTTFAALGQSVQLVAALQDALGHPVLSATVTWSSSDPSTVMVDPSSGFATAMKVGGPVTVTAASGGKSGTATMSVAQTVASVSVSPPTTTLVSFGETLQLTATALDASGATVVGLPVTWSSSNSSVASVSNSGLVTAVSDGGPVTFTATVGAKSGTATVTVAQAVNSIVVTPGTTTLVSFGATVQLTATPSDARGNPVSGATVTWSSGNAGVATVSPSGLVTAVANGGPVTFTASAGGKSGTASVTVAQAVASVAVSPPTTTLSSLGATVQLVATPQDARGNPMTGLTVTWSSSDAAIAMVSSSGLVTTIAVGGPVTITASAGGKSGTATVSVVQTVANVSVTPPATTLASLGATVQLVALATDANGATVNGLPVTWSSSNSSVASVSSTGLVTAVANGGPVTFSATVGGKTGTASVTVAQVLNAVVVTPGTATLVSLGQTVQLAADPQDALGHTVGGLTVTWTSSDPTTATVSTSGLATAVANGSVTITATAGAKAGTATVTVAQVVASVVVSPPTTTLASLGSTVQLNATPQDARGNPVLGQTVLWSSSDAAIAMVGSTGLVTAMANGGPVTLTASVGGKSGTATVTVAQAVAAVSVTPPTSTLVSIGETLQLTATATDANGITVNGLTVTWTSSNTLVASISSTGLVTAIANGGPVTFTATAGGKSGTATASVVQVVTAVVVTPATTTFAALNQTAQLLADPRDALGHTVSSATVTWTSSAPTIATVSTSGLVTSVANGSATITATAGGKSATSSVTVAQVIASIAITTQPSGTVQSGVTFPTVPIVTVKDAQGVGMAGQTVNISVATGGALTFTNGSATTNGTGVATFTGLSAVGLVGARTLNFTSGAIVSPATTTVTVNAGIPAAVAITTQPAPAVQSGIAFPTVPVVEVTDGSGNLVPSQAVTVSVATGGALTFTAGTATTNGSGVATFTGLAATGAAGDRTLRFTAGTAVSAASNTVTVSAGAPATVAITTQPGTPVRSGIPFTTVPVVTVKDGGANPVAGQAVTISVATGGALTFANGSATTDINGVATFTGLSATGLVGARTFLFTAGTVNSAATTSVQVNAGNPATVAITTQPAAIVQSGVVFPNPVPAVTVTDSATNVVSGQAVTISVASGNPLTWTAGTATTNASGVATFTGLVATGVVGPRTLQFTAGTIVSVPSNTVTVNGGPPATVTLTTPPPAAVQSGVVFPTIPVVTVTDASANPVVGQAVTVSVATGSALTFTAGTATTNASGVATFTGLVATGLVGNRTLKFTAGTVSATSGTVTVNAGLPKTVTVTTQPSSSVQSGVVFPVQPVMTVRDSLLNLVPNQLVTISVATGSPLTFTNGTATTNGSGVATFSGLAASGVVGARTVVFTAGTAVSTPASSVTVTSGPLGKIIVSPATTMLLLNGNTQQLSYVATDSAGNVLSPQPAISSWSSSSSGIATVSATGLVTAGTTNGTATITATIGTVKGTAYVMNGQVAVVTNYKGGGVSILNGTLLETSIITADSTLDVAITPDGTKAYVANNFAGNVSVIRLGVDTQFTAKIAITAPRGVAVAPNPSGNIVYFSSGLPQNRLVIRDTTNVAINDLKAGASPRYMVATATDVWITDSGYSATQGQILRYNRSTGTITDSIPVGGTPYGIALSGTKLYVTNRDGNSVSVISISGTPTVTKTITGFNKPWGVAVTANGTVYVANSGNNTVGVITTSTDVLSSTITPAGCTTPVGVAANATTAYVACFGSDRVALITTATNVVAGSVTVGSGPKHIALRTVQ